MKFQFKKLSIALAAVSVLSYSSLAHSASAVEYGLLLALAAPVIPSSNGLITNACTGEQVQLSGQFDTKLIVDQDDSGNIHLRAQILPKGLDGVGVNSGYIYHVVGAGNIIYNANVVEGATSFPTVANLTTHLKVISEGPASNFSINAHFVLRVEPDGTGTAVVDNIEASCS